MILPIVDLAAGLPNDDESLAATIDDACRTLGFFLVVNHGVDEHSIDRLDTLARQFFALDEQEKSQVSMALSGRVWRGWFPLGGELTSGRPDLKEGLYFGEELPPDDRPMHGPNRFPERPAMLRAAVLDHLATMRSLATRLVGLIDLGLGVDGRLASLVDDPLVLFRIFRYPPTLSPDAPNGPDRWGVGEHTDYGLLTLLHQDSAGGLEVRVDDEWRAVPPRRGSIVCNIGDMLEKATGGIYRSTPHRVRNRSSTDRISMPYFFDPGWGARVEPLVAGGTMGSPRWDDLDPHLFTGTYGDYLWSKVERVFPALADP